MMERRLHILILPMYYPEPDSSPHRGYMFAEQAKQLAANGMQVGVAFVEQRPLKHLSVKRFFKESHFQTSTEEGPDFNTMRMHAWNPKLSTDRGGKIWAYLTVQLVKHYIRQYGQPDLIHAHFNLWAGYAAQQVFQKMGIPYVLTEHASSINFGTTTHKQKAIIKSVCADAQEVICVGTMLEKNLQSIIADPCKTTVIPNFVDIETFEAGHRITHKEKEFVFVSVANLSRRKGLHELIEAFHQFVTTHTTHTEDKQTGRLDHLKLLIVGDGEERENLQQQIDRLGLQQQISLVGRLGRIELAQLLRRCDAFVLPSHAETFGIVYIEAMATGMPAIGTICGGPEDIITPECGYLLAPGDVAMLAQKMKEMYDNYDRFDKKVIRQSVAQRFDFRLAGQQLKKIYLKSL